MNDDALSTGDVKRRKWKKENLNKIIKSNSGIKKLILTNRIGLIIASASISSELPIDSESIGAIASAVLIISEKQGKNLDLGDLYMVTSEFSKGKIFATSCGPSVLCLISEIDVEIGLINLVIEQCRKELPEILKAYGEDYYWADFLPKNE